MPSVQRELPALFVVESSGDALVNYRFLGHSFVIDGVPERIVLVDGTGKHQRRVLIVRVGGV